MFARIVLAPIVIVPPFELLLPVNFENMTLDFGIGKALKAAD